MDEIKKMCRKTRILYIDNSIGFGGAIKSLSLVLGYLSNVEPFLISSQYKDITNKFFKNARIYRPTRFLDYRLRQRLFIWCENHISITFFRSQILKVIVLVSYVEDVINIARICWIAKRNKIELIHLNNTFVLDGLTAAKLLGIPSLVHFRGIFTKTSDRSGLKYKDMASYIIGVSKASTKSVYETGASSKKITTVYDPVDVGAFDKCRSLRSHIRKNIGLTNQDIAVGIFGRIIPWKGQMEFIYSVINAMRKNANIKAVIVGDVSDGTPDYLSKIKDIINQSEYKNNIIFAGYQENVEGYYLAMDIVVHASIEPEPYGMVVPEAMAAEKPVIATNAGGPPEVITHGVDGLLVEPGDIDGMSAAILELAGDPGKRRKMGANGYKKVKAQFTIAHIASQVEKIYQNILSKPRT